MGQLWPIAERRRWSNEASAPRCNGSIPMTSFAWLIAVALLDVPPSVPRSVIVADAELAAAGPNRSVPAEWNIQVVRMAMDPEGSPQRHEGHKEDNTKMIGSFVPFVLLW